MLEINQKVRNCEELRQVEVPIVTPENNSPAFCAQVTGILFQLHTTPLLFRIPSAPRRYSLFDTPPFRLNHAPGAKRVNLKKRRCGHQKMPVRLSIGKVTSRRELHPITLRIRMQQKVTRVKIIPNGGIT